MGLLSLSFLLLFGFPSQAHYGHSHEREREGTDPSLFARADLSIHRHRQFHNAETKVSVARERWIIQSRGGLSNLPSLSPVNETSRRSPLSILLLLPRVERAFDRAIALPSSESCFIVSPPISLATAPQESGRKSGLLFILLAFVLISLLP